jgi:hypothetical protein
VVRKKRIKIKMMRKSKSILHSKWRVKNIRFEVNFGYRKYVEGLRKGQIRILLLPPSCKGSFQHYSANDVQYSQMD